MILLKTGSFLLLFCLISVSAKDIRDGESSKKKTEEVASDIEAEPSTNLETKLDHKPIAKASKVSEFYIGDLLRTSEKEQLDTSSTIHNPVSSTPEYNNHRAIVPGDASLIAGYKAPAGHVYAGEDIILSLTQHGRIPIPVQLSGDPSSEAFEKAPIHQIGVFQRDSIPSEGGVPVSRRYEESHRNHKGSDCKKHAHAPSASEDRYISNGRVPYNEGRAPPPPAEYRNPESYRDESSYEDSPSHSSQGYSESYPTRSKSYASEHDSNTKSKSMDSYTTSKSSSSSRTLNNKNKGGKVFVFNNRKPAQQSYSSRPREQGSRNKKKSRPSQDSAPYSDEPSSWQSSPDNDPPPQYHQNYPPQAPTRHSHSSHSNTRSTGSPKQSPHYSDQPAPPHHERGNYRKPKESQGTRYYNDEYTQAEAPVRQHGPPPNYHSNENAEEPAGPYRTRNEEPYANEPPPHHREGNRHQSSGNYNSPRPYRDGPQYQQEPPQTPPGPAKGRRNPNYGGYSQENSPAQSESYERNPHPPRSPGRKRPEYSHEETPYTSNESSDNYQRPRRPAGRAVRSSTQHYQSDVSEGRSDSTESVVQHKPREHVVQGNVPQQYGSVSFSESSYNMGEPPTTQMSPVHKKTKVQPRMYERPEKMVNPLLSGPPGEEGRDPGYHSSYKPFNSEYPASYANDQYSRDPHGPEPHSAEQDYEPESYEEPQEHHDDHDDGFKSHSKTRQGKSNTKTKSDVTGYKESYDSHEPLDLDDAFFEKYGISKNAKIIVATAMNPGLFVADGTGIAEGGASDDDSHERINQEPSSHENSREPSEYNSKTEADDEDDEPLFEPKSEFEPPQEAPGSFTQLVNSNPKFLRKLKRSKRPEIGEFREYDPSLDELVFRSGVGDPKEFVRSQGSREIVQQHGDGVSRIIFNQVTKKQKEAASENKEEYLPNHEASDEEKLESAKSEKVEQVLKPETVAEKSV
ncbi:uncharacterized protein NPIL_177941 [Nephila pilipes]|uniref:Uncharacterized protein n=1 Tax=Nephila pilipes TaxID=299642 RepID=A0A8X6TJQ5_NEPPI|nr:uncharacterized protein NPIL_177941 [Nephila pilipes]